MFNVRNPSIDDAFGFSVTREIGELFNTILIDVIV